jgi:thiamine pyrophosphokinase
LLEQRLAHNIAEIIKQTDKHDTEQEILKSVLEMSKKEIPNIDQAIQFIIEMGFTEEEAVLAYSAVGGDPDHMLQYLYSLYH